MPAASINRTALSLGLIASALGLGLLATSPADARTRYLPQRTHGQQFPAFTQWSYGTPGVYRNTPPGNVVAMQAASSAAAGDRAFGGADILSSLSKGND